MVRAYIELLDKWVKDKNEHIVSVYLTTRLDSNESKSGKNCYEKELSHSFILRKPPYPQKQAKRYKADIGLLPGTSFTVSNPLTISIYDNAVEFSENLFRAIYVQGQQFVPPDKRPLPYVKQIGHSLFEAIFQAHSIAGKLFDEFPDPKN